MARNRKGKSAAQGRRRNSTARRPRQNDSVTLNRSDYLGPLPAGTGGFVSAVIAIYPGDPSVAGISALYSEYRYSRFNVRLIPRSSTSSLGTHFSGIRYAAPIGAPISLQAASVLSAFSVGGAAHSASVSSSLQVSASARRWFRLVPNPNAEQLNDPDIVQAWAVVGADSLQSGVISADVHVRYTLHLRGSVDLPGTTIAEDFEVHLRL